ncbi:hypothetical protein B0H10DRAFT_2158860 [Mycena sp. CBHHK59/15]|nr:hypothetical protein B0H10DRAFT_2158860 [Mycena sp. CBHHK59/15]
MCRDYGLNVSGNKKDLTERLREFSKNSKTKPKKSANRRAVIIDADRVTERSKDSTVATNHSLHDRMKIIESQLAIIAASTVARPAQSFNGAIGPSANQAGHAYAPNLETVQQLFGRGDKVHM